MLKGVYFLYPLQNITTLRELEQHELICRHDFQEMPLRVEYSLTQQGQKLKPIFDALWKWGEEHFYR
ncbi:MAG: helix-turn-helix transcriptional regulator [Leptolyngbyaceae cyanobacterium SL_5_9]|nr:helix-turn-helix transcriptional regulator [Leptolyngbyaceae cyanobacterium SL_5_9]